MSQSQHDARRALVLVGAVISTWALVAPSDASAATFTVNSLGDAGDAAIDSVCDSDASTPGQQCTLRAAIAESNATAGTRDVIAFSVTGTIMIGSELLITNEVRIQGPGSGQLTIDRSALVRHFWVQGAAGTYSFEGLTLQHGRDVHERWVQLRGRRERLCVGQHGHHGDGGGLAGPDVRRADRRRPRGALPPACRG